MKLFYIRHAEPVYNPHSLTELGFKQAEALSQRLKSVKFDKIFASPAERTMLTAAPTAQKLDMEIIQADFAQEKYAAEEFATTVDGKITWIFSLDLLHLRYVHLATDGLIILHLKNIILKRLLTAFTTMLISLCLSLAISTKDIRADIKLLSLSITTLPLLHTVALAEPFSAVCLIFRIRSLLRILKFAIRE